MRAAVGKTPLSGVIAAAQERWDRRRRDEERQAWDDAERASERKARRLARESGPSSPHVLDARERHAITLHGLGRFAEAETLSRDLAGSMAASPRADQSFALEARRSHADALRERGKTAEAEALYRDVVLRHRGDLAALLRDRGDREQAAGLAVTDSGAPVRESLSEQFSITIAQ
jgi:hypothetical protein